jgi:two-component system chemotaxis response regulator CheB
MPGNALRHTPGAIATPIAGLADAICRAIDEPLPAGAERAANPLTSMSVENPDRSDDNPRAGALTGLTCPECGGALWEHDEQGVLRYKCHVGHAYSSDSLEVSQSQSLEGALWAALRSLQERADLFRRLARRSGDGAHLEEKARVAEEHARVLRELVTSFGREPGGAGDVAEGAAQ